MSTLEYIKEISRQKKANDENYLKRILYFFELVIPAEAAEKGDELNFMFPLIIPPEAYSMSEPYLVEVTQTQNGGLYVEENGILGRDITLRGNTGFKPRRLKTFNGDSGASDSLKNKLTGMGQGIVNNALGGIVDLGKSVGVPVKIDSEYKSFGRSLEKEVVAAISGQKHFQYLQDSVFRTYADLKSDPATAAGTSLIFHNPKDRESWLVIPKRFGLDRDKGSRFLYNYNIELLAVAPAEERKADFSEDKGLIDQFKDGLRMVAKGQDLVKGAFDDLVALQGDIRGVVGNITTLIDNFTRIIESVQEFLDGNERLINSTHAWHVSQIELVEEMQELLAEEKDKGTSPGLPDVVVNKMRLLCDGMELIGSQPDLFSSSSSDRVDTVKNLQVKSRTVSTDRVQAALSSDPVSSFEDLENLGSGLTPGEAAAIDGELDVGTRSNTYSSSRTVTIEEGDTLASLAARWMGDARLWQYIAILNGLTPPFVDDLASTDLLKLGDSNPFSNALGRGDRIQIPSNNASTLSYPILPVQGVALSEPINNQLLGIDVLLEPATETGKLLLDIPVDVEKGSTDVKLVEGLQNFQQAIATRVSTERGTNVLYKNVGVRRVVGLGFIIGDVENARYRLRESILSDPRASSIDNLDFSQINDSLLVDANINIRGFSEAIPVSVLIR